MVNVVADTEDISAKSDDFFGDFDVVIGTCNTLAEYKRINTICRLKNVKFICGDVVGMYGYSFSDLLIHEFVE